MRRKISVRRSFISWGEIIFSFCIVRNWRRASMSMIPATNVLAPAQYARARSPGNLHMRLRPRGPTGAPYSGHIDRGEFGQTCRSC